MIEPPADKHDLHQQGGVIDDISEIANCLCPNCHGGNAVTVVLPTQVPFFREIIIMTLTCEDCSFQNSEVTFGGEIREKGERIELRVTRAEDRNRQLVKSDSATLYIPQLELEIPSETQRGMISTLEGFLKRAAENLEALQPERLRLGDIDNFHRCRRVIQHLRWYAGLEFEGSDDDDDDAGASSNRFPFDVIVDDPAGNSFIENPHAPAPDPNMKSTKYFRTPTQDMSLGLQPSKAAIDAGSIDDTIPKHKNSVNSVAGSHPIDMREMPVAASSDNIVKREVMKFSTECPNCCQPAETAMCVADIPHFKEVIIMCLVCEQCGFRSNEIKGGGAMPNLGSKITLFVQGEDDLSREVLKSDTAGVRLPELELELDEGGLDGVYTTIEGLLKKILGQLKMANPFGGGDAALKQHMTNDGGAFSEPLPSHARYLEFLSKLSNMADGKMFPFTLILSDPLANSFVGPVPQQATALTQQGGKDGNEDYVDIGLDIKRYERSHEQNEILGINDMKTNNYHKRTDEATKTN